MTFEQNYKEILRTQLEAVTNRKVYVSNDIHYQPLNDDPEAIVMVINTGGTSRSAVDGFDMNTLPISINFICQANYLQEIFGILNQIAKENNAKYYQTEIDGTTYFYQVIYSDAFQIGGAYKVHLERRTVNCITGNWLLNITYSENAIIEPSICKLKVGSTEYDIKYINRYDMSATPVTESVQYIDEDGQEELFIDTVLSYSFVLLKVNNDALQTELRKQIAGKIDLNQSVLTLKIDGDEISIKKLVVTEIYENKASVYNLVLTKS